MTLLDTASELAHVELAKLDLEFFVDFVYILEPPPGGGRIKFEKWPHLLHAIKVLTDEREIVWLKARQIGASWLIAAHFLRCAMFEPGAQLLMFSQGEEECKQLLWKAKFIWRNLPQALQIPVKSEDNQQEFAFPSTDSWIRALPSTQKAGRSYTATKAVFDEADFHPHLEENVTAVEPTLNDNGGQLILASTSNGDSADSLFKRRYRSGRDPDGD